MGTSSPVAGSNAFRQFSDVYYDIVGEYGFHWLNSATRNQAIADAVNLLCNTTGKKVFLQNAPAGQYYNLNNTMTFLTYHGGWEGQNSDLANLRWDHSGGEYPGIIIDTYKNRGWVTHLGFQFTGGDSSDAAAIFIQVGTGRYGTGSSIQANITTRIGWNKFNGGSRHHIYSHQECDNIEICGNISFSNIGGNNVDSARIYLEMKAPNREAPTACARIWGNHMTQPDCDPGENKFGIVIIGSDNCQIESNIINNHDCEYVLWSPSDASMRENSSIELKQCYGEEQTDWRKTGHSVIAINTAYAQGDLLVAPDANDDGLIWEVTTAGTTSGTLPTFGASGDDNFGPGVTVSEITNGTMTMQAKYASIGVISSGENRRIRIIGGTFKGKRQYFRATGASRWLIENIETTQLTPDVKTFFGVSGFQNSNGFAHIKGCHIRGNVRPWRTANTDTNQFRIKWEDNRLTGGDNIGLFPSDTLGTFYYGYPAAECRVVSTQFDKTTTSLADVTGLSIPRVLAAGKYRFKAVLYTTSDVAGGVKASINGTCTATSIVYEGITYSGGAIVAQTRGTSMNATVGAVTAVTAATMIIEGSITVNAAGTLLVRFACNAATGTSSVLVGSTFEIEPVR